MYNTIEVFHVKPYFGAVRLMWRSNIKIHGRRIPCDCKIHNSLVVALKYTILFQFINPDCKLRKLLVVGVKYAIH